MDERQFLVAEGGAGQRVDRYLAASMTEYSRSQIQSWIRADRVTVNGAVVRASYAVETGDAILVTVPPPAVVSLDPVEMVLPTLFEDDDVLVVDKPAGLQVHPGAGSPRPTLVHGLLHRYPGWQPPGAASRPGIVHRLDRDTSGLMMIARTPRAFQRLGEQIRAREAKRRYLALVWGAPREDQGTVDRPLGRHTRERTKVAVVADGRPARTHWRILARFDSLALLDVALDTGRTHQIRVHLAHIGHPIFGDPTYGRDRWWIEQMHPQDRPAVHQLLRHLNRQALHAYHLAFRHPMGIAGLRFEAPPPPDLERVLRRLYEQGDDA